MGNPLRLFTDWFYARPQRRFVRMREGLSTYVSDEAATKDGDGRMNAVIKVNVPRLRDPHSILESLAQEVKGEGDWEGLVYDKKSLKATSVTGDRIINAYVCPRKLVIEVTGDGKYVNKIRDIARKL